jgi:hypothetical protein
MESGWTVVADVGFQQFPRRFPQIDCSSPAKHHSLRGWHSRNRMYHRLGTDAYNLFRIISERGNKKPVVRWIETKMINAPFHVW